MTKQYPTLISAAGRKRAAPSCDIVSDEEYSDDSIKSTYFSLIDKWNPTDSKGDD